MHQLFVNDDGELFIRIDANRIRRCDDCVLCGEVITDDIWGHNPAPLKQEGTCCTKCNFDKVVPAREKLMFAGKVVFETLKQ
jgi:hypothetical protein